MPIGEQFRAYACKGAGQPIERWTYEPRPLGPMDVEVAITHCGICYSDIHTLDSGWGPTAYPVVVGHEIVGTVRALGPSATGLKIGDRVGVGAQVWSCQQRTTCADCKTDNDQLCARRVFTYNAKYEDGASAYGGYAEAVRVDARYVFKVPDGMSNAVVAPLLCAGVTVYSPLAHHGVQAGMRVGVVGIGGLGHLAVQFASKMGAEVVAVSHSLNKQEECKKLGATGFVNIGDKEAVKKALMTLDMLVVTSNHKGQPWDTYLQLLKNKGTLVLLAVPEEPFQLSTAALILRELTMTGSLIGSRKTVQDMLDFAGKHDVKPWIEEMPMSQVNEAVQRVRDGKPRYRVVLKQDF